MNTRLIMTASAIVLGISGITLTFAPDVLSGFMRLDFNPVTSILLQVIGALYFAFAMLNWMNKSNLIGGIYNRPVAIANLTHCIVAGLAIIKAVKVSIVPELFTVAAIIYLILAICFGIILFTHPLKKSSDESRA